ncbi:hypothetical protein J4460_02525 [Candidatus Woesearchaeota archaeon]|nr:MAG: hypothetical protein QS99_C0005G0005 [archaeon GW2011_AR4]MBS3129525.1 hypothetical protein [Candidatus Woesearchaeota archaeon]HIH37493.1 hypothetical protein [Candidatus Woesearchaeota archaeon]HIH49594.1 hypothetical protein [Candidatus Woesearchaeota archaeon]HIJ03252.1 hypothetical protein [Candidatus Woesearchaeota archaeon]
MTQTRSILLVNAGNDRKYDSGGVHWTAYPPLGVISLGTHINTYSDWTA